jgi:hypothetical protein
VLSESNDSDSGDWWSPSRYWPTRL